jgi:twinkle protein
MSDARHRLPPHSVEAEQGALGSILRDPSEGMEKARKVITHEEWFYDLRHQAIWLALVALHEAAASIDLTTLVQRLRDFGHLEQAGGVVYVAELDDATPSPSHLESYLQILREKLTARKLLKACADTAMSIQDWEGAVDSILDRAIHQFTSLDEMRRASGDTPARVRLPRDYGEDHFNLWFGTLKGEPGLDLPFGLPWKIRESELTLVLGENGAGKTTFFLWLLIHLLSHPDSKVLIASMEVRPEMTLKMMTSQLLGATELENNDENQALVRRALDWLNKRVVVYDFLGIVHWRTLLQAMEHCSQKLGTNLVLIDSLMRLGIADDDYAQQGDCLKLLANYSLKHRAHTFLVNHLNKSDRDTKSRNRGSGQITDNAHNIVSIARNEKKWSKIDALKDDLRSGMISEDTYHQQIRPLVGEYDSIVHLHKQRWPGSRQNGSKRLWFNSRALQYAEEAGVDPMNLLVHFERHPKVKPLRLPPATE